MEDYTEKLTDVLLKPIQFFLLTLSNPETLCYTDEQKANYRSILCVHIKPPYTDSNRGNEMLEQSSK